MVGGLLRLSLGARDARAELCGVLHPMMEAQALAARSRHDEKKVEDALAAPLPGVPNVGERL
jgi:hypothetical protein